jgi:exopolysaccharide biosynthesis polyprenyl glycosylphosphotransferase
MSNFKETLKNLEIDEVFFAVDLNMIENIHDIFTYLDTIGVSYHMMINESVHTYSDKNLNIRPISSNYYNMPMLSFHSVTASHFKLYIKNGIEKVFAVLLIIFSFPVLFLFGLLVYLTSKGPILFKQERVGLHGRKFYQYKLRSMIVDAEELKKNFAHLNEQSGPVFKIKNDPRLTSVGKFMRKYSIDELPQLFNIMRGSMNLIGPRPPVPSEVKEYKDSHLRRLSMKPGITGLWQVSGRNTIEDFDEWVKLDLEYIDNWSFLLDFRIAVKTVSTVLSGTGM